MTNANSRSFWALFLAVLAAQEVTATAHSANILSEADGPVNVVTNLVLTPEETIISASWILENNDYTAQTIEVSYAEEDGETVTCSMVGSSATNTDNCLLTNGQLPELSPCTGYTVTVTPQDGGGATNGVPASDADCTTGCAGGETCSIPSTPTPSTTTTLPSTTKTTTIKRTTPSEATSKTTSTATKTTTAPSTSTTTTTGSTSKTSTTAPLTTTIQTMTTVSTQTQTQSQTPSPSTAPTTTTTDTTTIPIPATKKPAIRTDPVDVVLLSLIALVSALNIAFVATFYVDWDSVLKKLPCRSSRKMPT